MDGKGLAGLVRQSQKHLYSIVDQFSEEHGDFAPTPDMFTVKAQFRHIAQTVDWLREGAWGSGFDMDFEKHAKDACAECTFAEARQELDDAFDRLYNLLEPMNEAEAHAPMADNPIFGPLPRSMVIGGVTDHCAHHRGALTVYLRLNGITPNMVYAD